MPLKKLNIYPCRVLTHRIKILQTIKSGKSHITHYTSYIEYLFVFFLSKYLKKNTVQPFNNSERLIMKQITKYLLLKLTTSTVHMLRSGLKLGKPNISWQKHTSFKTFSFSPKNEILRKTVIHQIKLFFNASCYFFY